MVKKFLTRQSITQDFMLDNAEHVYSHLVMSEHHILDGSSRRDFYFTNASTVDTRRKLMLPVVNAVSSLRRIYQMTNSPYKNSIVYRSLSCYCKDVLCAHIGNP